MPRMDSLGSKMVLNRSAVIMRFCLFSFPSRDRSLTLAITNNPPSTEKLRNHEYPNVVYFLFPRLAGA
jgi:hypothetical protein